MKPWLVLALFLVDPWGSNGPVFAQKLVEADVRSVLLETAKVFDVPYTVAVTNREGVVLGVLEKTASPAETTSLVNFKFRLGPGNTSVAAAPEGTADVAIGLARTGAFFSHNQAPLSSRTVRFISGIHFPPGVANTPNAALYGIENTNRGCFLSGDYLLGKEIPRPRRLNGDPGIGIVTGKRDVTNSAPYPGLVNPGGIPIYRGSKLVGGVGVAGLDALADDAMAIRVAEFAALQGVLRARGSLLLPVPNPLPDPGEVFIDGIRLPFVGRTKDELQSYLAGIRPRNTPDPDDRPDDLLGSFTVGPLDSPTEEAPRGWLVLPRDGQLLSAEEVDRIVASGVRKANLTRAAIRLSPGQPSKMVIAVGDLDGTILGMYRMIDATIFSVDVAATKARNVVYFSGPTLDPADLPGVPLGTAVTARTIGFGAQPLFPAGIGGQPSFPPSPADRTREGPFFRSLLVPDVNNPCTQGREATNPNQSGIVFFPGSSPLYKDGRLAGGLGVSGDGVEQDDYVTAAGYVGFEPPPEIRADRVFVDGVRLPYFKFPRNPEEGVIPDLRLPAVIYAHLSGGAKGSLPTSIEIEMAAGPDIDLETTADSLEIRIDGVPQVLARDSAGPVTAGTVGVLLPFFNFIRLTLPETFDDSSDVQVSLRPTDVLGRQSDACLFLGAPPTMSELCVEIASPPQPASKENAADFNRDTTINAIDLLMLRRAIADDSKSTRYDLNGNGDTESTDVLEFGRRWLTEPKQEKGSITPR